jgi:hypothetical protein
MPLAVNTDVTNGNGHESSPAKGDLPLTLVDCPAAPQGELLPLNVV